MKFRRLLVLLLLFAGGVHADDFLDQVDEKLTFSGFNDQFRARLSGTLDLEFYAFDQPSPGLIDSTSDSLFNPRLTLFLDGQIGPTIYFFAQARADRHFDPTDTGAQVRMDEYALRFTPWDDGRLSMQLGKFATVIGRWVERHLSWDNPFVNAPLIYENVTAIEDRRSPAFTADLDANLRDGKREYNPAVWGPSYASGVSIAGRIGHFDYVAEVKNSSLASRPESWDVTRVDFARPTISARFGYRPNEMWNFGVFGSEGPYFLDAVAAGLPPGRALNDYHEILIGQDASFEWHHIQIWTEFHEVRFEVPLVDDADVFGYFLEAKYKFTPQLFAALRWNQQLYGDVLDGMGGAAPWGHDAWRIDHAIAYRFTPHTQLKLQYDLEHNDNARHGFGHLFATQLTIRF